MRKLLLLTLAAVPLQACSTFSFAPPSVNLTKELTASDDMSCKPTTGNPVADGKNLESAQTLIDNFILVYRCAAHQAANGRQGFQIPSFIAALTGIAAPAFGAGSDVSLAAGVTAATFNSANGYYVPQQKSAVIDSALDALLCVKNESVGVPFIDVTAKDNDPAPLGENAPQPTTGVTVEAAKQYHSLVLTSLFQIERILGSRLRDMGKYDPAGLVAEIDALNKKINPDPAGAPNEAGEPDPDADGDAGGPAAMGANNDNRDANVRPKGTVASSSKPITSETLKISDLKPRMQLCVVRAKL